VLPSHKAHRAVLISISLALSQTPVYTVRPWYRGYGASESRGVPLLLVLIVSTHRRMARLCWPGWLDHVLKWYTH